jgi:hypothetical protein
MAPQETTNGIVTKLIEDTISNGNNGTGDYYDPDHKGPSGTSGYSGPAPGTRSNNYKYHFKGKYPKPR